jgi:DHA1 family multidrug resistance protein-like MFS transporter
LSAPEGSQRWGYPRAAINISLGNCLCDAACNMWWPFIPLYLMDVGASTPAEAMYWLAIASIAQGIGRIVAAPLWGVLSDRYGRKLMYLRTLVFLVITTVMFGFLTEPWQVVVALGLHGAFSGYDGPAVALLSVSVPDSQFKKSLGLMSSLRFLGQSASPAIGAVLAVAISLRSTILISAVATAVVTIAIAYMVPSDRHAGKTTSKSETKFWSPVNLDPFKPTNQLWLAVFLFGMIMALAQVLKITTPIALREIEGGEATIATGIAFTLGALASAVGAFVISARYFRLGRLRPALGVCTLAIAASFLLLAASHTVPMYIAAFALISLLQAASIPTLNMLIAFNTPPARRGTAFGMGSSAQAFSIMLGPLAGALFVATSMSAGFIGVTVFCVILAFVVRRSLVEPRPEQAR